MKFKYLASLALVLVFFVLPIIVAKKLPPEVRWLLSHMNEQEKVVDMTDHPEKYQNRPCLEVQAGDNTYCFDRSRVTNVKIYYRPQTTEFMSLWFDFFSKIVPKGERNEHVIERVTLNVIRYTPLTKFTSTPHRMVYNSIVSHYKDGKIREREGQYKTLYQELVQNNNGVVNFSKLHNTYDPETEENTSSNKFYYTYVENALPITYASFDKSTGVYKYTGKIRYQTPEQPLYLEFYFLTNSGGNEDDHTLRYVNVAKEISRFLEESKVSIKTK